MSKTKYTQIAANQVPANVRWDVPAHCAGQIVEVAYAAARPSRDEAGPGDPYQRVTDRSDRSVTYYRSVTR